MNRIALTLLSGLIGQIGFANPTTAPATTQPAKAPAMKLPVNHEEPKTPEAIATDRFYEASRRSMENLRKTVTINTPRKIEKISDIFTMTCTGNWLDAQINLPKDYTGTFHLQAQNDASIWGGSIMNYRVGIDMEMRTQRTLGRYDFDSDEPGHVFHTFVAISDKSFSLSGQAIGMRISLIESATTARISVYNFLDGRYKLIFNKSAPNFRELEHQNPLEIRRYLAPLLYNLTGRYFFAPGATDIYLAFDQIKPSADVIEKVNAILPRLDDDLYEVREAAACELLGLGDAGVHAMLHLNRDNLTGEQSDRLDSILSLQHRVNHLDFHKLLSDPTFLIDCLAYEDPQVRALAATHLEKSLGRRIELDLNLPSEKICAAILELHEETRKITDANIAEKAIKK